MGFEINLGGKVRELDGRIGSIETKYIYSAETTASITPESNTEYRYSNDMVSLTITMPDTVPQDYAVYVVFTSGETTTGVNYPDTMLWSGDDVIDGIFAPLPSRRYNIGIWYDGQAINAVSRSVSI